MATNPALIQIQSNLHKLQETVRVVKGLLKNQQFRNQYEIYLLEGKWLKSARTREEYCNPKTLSSVFESYKHLEIFIDQNMDRLTEMEPERLQQFLALREKLHELRAQTYQLLEDESIRLAFEEFLTYEGIQPRTIKAWFDTNSKQSQWFDMMNGWLSKFIAKRNDLFRVRVENEND